MRPTLTAALLLLAACGTTYQVPIADGGAAPRPLAVSPGAVGSLGPARFRGIADRVERSAEAFCNEEFPGRPARQCDFDIRLIDNPRMGPNAFQTIGRDGRPVVVMTRALLAEAGSADEVGFVLSHEAGHHIAQHIPRQQQQQALGALILGGLVSATGGRGKGGSDQAIAEAMNLGAALGGRVYGQTFELEADTLGAFIAARAGYDPERGAALFARPSLANEGAGLLSTHPPSSRRFATLQRVAAEIRRQQAAGLTPRPAYAERRLPL